MDMQDPADPGAGGANEGEYPQWFLKWRMAQASVKPNPILTTESITLKIENHGVFACAPAYTQVQLHPFQMGP